MAAGESASKALIRGWRVATQRHPIQTQTIISRRNEIEPMTTAATAEVIPPTPRIEITTDEGESADIGCF